MSDGFGVQPTVVTAAANAVDAALSGISTDGMAGVSAAAVGHGELATALADFGDEWGRGVRQMAGDGQRFASELHATAAEYQRNEAEVARSFAGLGD